MTPSFSASYGDRTAGERAVEGGDDGAEHREVDPLDRRGREVLGAGRVAAVEGGEVLVLVDADPPQALLGRGLDAGRAGRAAGAEDDVGTFADELLRRRTRPCSGSLNDSL